MKRFESLIIASLIALCVSAQSQTDKQGTEPKAHQLTTKQERNYIREGNKLYEQKKFADAEVAYRKALESVPTSQIAQFNLAASLLRQGGTADPNNGNNPVATATEILQKLAQESTDAHLAGKSFYNLGNLAFNSQDYSKSIELYKNSLRKNPDDNKARENLRLAQLKIKEQQQQQQNQDKNKDQNQDQNQDKDQNKDQNENKQDHNKDQNQDNKDQNQDQNKDNQKDNKQDKNKRQTPQQQGISDANAEKILKAMENEEAATRKRVEAQKKKAENAKRKKITNPW